MKKLVQCQYCSKMFSNRGIKNHTNACAKKYEIPSKTDDYRKICFYYHKKECVVCGEHRAVHVHHVNENPQDNRPENLVPLCANHHQYWHSGDKNLVEETVYTYIKKWKRGLI